MNFSKTVFLSEFCKNIISQIEKKSVDIFEVKQKLEREIYKTNKRTCKHWGMCSSDKEYLSFLKSLNAMLDKENAFPLDGIKDIYNQITNCTSTKIKVLILTQEVSVWPSLESVFKACERDSDIEVKLVYTPFLHNNLTTNIDYYDIYRYDMRLPILRHTNYDLSQDSPDVVFMQKPYNTVPENYTPLVISQIAERIVYIPYGLELTTSLRKFGFQYFLHYKAWRHIVYGEIVKQYAQKYGYRNGENIAVLGHPKADSYIDLSEKRTLIPEIWRQKINGRKVILWTPHHLIDLNNKECTSTWLLWNKTIFSYFKRHKELVLLFRPHLLMFGALINQNYMTEEEKNRFIKDLDREDNVIYDNTSDYRIAFYTSDALITDGTSFSFEYLYTGQPEMITPRNIDSMYCYEDVMEALYIGDCESKIEQFLDMVACGQDPKKDKRREFSNKLFVTPADGITVGENIVQYIKKELVKEELEAGRYF